MLKPFQISSKMVLGLCFHLQQTLIIECFPPDRFYLGCVIIQQIKESTVLMCLFGSSVRRLKSVTCRWGGHHGTCYLATRSAARWPLSWQRPPHSWSVSCTALTTGPTASTRPWSNGSTRSKPASESRPARPPVVRGWKRAARCRAARSTTPRERARKRPRSRRRKGGGTLGSTAWASCRSTTWGHCVPRCGQCWPSLGVQTRACVLAGGVCTSRRGGMQPCWAWSKKGARQRRCSGTRRKSPSGIKWRVALCCSSALVTSFVEGCHVFKGGIDTIWSKQFFFKLIHPQNF